MPADAKEIRRTVLNVKNEITPNDIVVKLIYLSYIK